MLASTMPPAQKPRDADAMRKALGDELVRRELAAQEATKLGLDNRTFRRRSIWRFRGCWSTPISPSTCAHIQPVKS
jgi:hypothetical protein